MQQVDAVLNVGAQEIGTRGDELAPNGAAGAPVDSCYTFVVCFWLDIYGFVL